MKNILIVEDDKGLNQGLCKALQSADVKTASCFSIKEARQLMTEGSTELVILDINLPDGNGLDFLQEIKMTYASVLVILLTANDTDMDILGGVVVFVGILNFLNANITSVMTRKHEHAMLQSVGMSGQQLQLMLMLEGVFFAGSVILISAVISLLIGWLIGSVVEEILFFVSFNVSITPVIVCAPIFIALGLYIPIMLYDMQAKKPLVERLRESQ